MDSLNQKLSEFKFPILLSLLGLVLIIGGIFSSGFLEKEKPYPKESIVEAQAGLKVDLSGAIKSPGVYTLTSDSRIEDAIVKAGGFAENANKNYISKNLNLAQKVTDGQKIYIPFEGEVSVQSVTSGQVAGISTSKVGINSGTQAQLEELPGIGPVTAQKIINNRPYGNINELVSKKSVSNSIFEKIKDQIDLN